MKAQLNITTWRTAAENLEAALSREIRPVKLTFAWGVVQHIAGQICTDLGTSFLELPEHQRDDMIQWCRDVRRLTHA